MQNKINRKLMKNKEGLFHIAVSAVIENREELILITKRSLTRDHRPGEWGLIGGRIDQGEKDMVSALKREIDEEIGLQIDVIAPFRTFYFEYGTEKKSHFGVNFYCVYGAENKIILKDKENDAYKWVSPQKALRMIKDANTQEAIHVYQKFRQHYI